MIQRVRKDIETMLDQLLYGNEDNYLRYLWCCKGSFYTTEDEECLCINCVFVEAMNGSRIRYRPTTIHHIIDESLGELKCDRCSKPLAIWRDTRTCELCTDYCETHVRPFELLGLRNRNVREVME